MAWLSTRGIEAVPIGEFRKLSTSPIEEVWSSWWRFPFLELPLKGRASGCCAICGCRLARGPYSVCESTAYLVSYKLIERNKMLERYRRDATFQKDKAVMQNCQGSLKKVF
jgi:hypothetical protein